MPKTGLGNEEIGPFKMSFARDSFINS